MDRISWDEYFFGVTRLIAKRSNCIKPGRQIGAIIVKDNQILSTGYSGAAMGIPHCKVCPRLEAKTSKRRDECRAVHAEINAIALAARKGISIDGASIYCTLFPCHECLSALINAGIVSIIYDQDTEDKLNKEILRQSKLISRRFNEKKE